MKTLKAQAAIMSIAVMAILTLPNASAVGETVATGAYTGMQCTGTLAHQIDAAYFEMDAVAIGPLKIGHVSGTVASDRIQYHYGCHVYVGVTAFGNGGVARVVRVALKGVTLDTCSYADASNTALSCLASGSMAIGAVTGSGLVDKDQDYPTHVSACPDESLEGQGFNEQEIIGDPLPVGQPLTTVAGAALPGCSGDETIAYIWIN